LRALAKLDNATSYEPYCPFEVGRLSRGARNRRESPPVVVDPLDQLGSIRFGVLSKQVP
jgi:hypothetical protein